MSGGFRASFFKKKVKEEEPANLGLARVIKYDVLKKATNSFGTEIGSGAFGRVYLGKLRDQMVAVKILYDRNPKRLEQFFNEVAVLSSLRHKNLVTLYGCTNPRRQELLLVYDYVPNGTVADHLHGQQSTLSWTVRIQIAVETAEALTYLHAREPPVIHRDVKTPNILLDYAFHVKVADLGMCRLMPYDATHVSTVPQGTMGYRDPEYDRYFRISDKTDVYSFGVVLMELISGQEAVDVTRDPENIYLDGMARNKILNKKLEEFVDPNLEYHSNDDVRQMVNSVAELANQCLLPKGELRPSMVQVVTILKGIQNDIQHLRPDEVDVASPAPKHEGMQNVIQHIGLTDVDVASFVPQHELNDGSHNKDQVSHAMAPVMIPATTPVMMPVMTPTAIDPVLLDDIIKEVVESFGPQQELNDSSLNKDQVSPVMMPVMVPVTTPVMMSVMTPTAIDPVLLDDIINRLLEVRGRPEKRVLLSEAEIRQLCVISRDIFIQQPSLLELEAPIKVCGDIHGRYSDLLRLFEYGGFPPQANYLFMGNYVDHGTHSLETICLLLAYKIKYPENFFLLRGNHECASISRVHGFYDECKRRYNGRLWNIFTDCFNCLPVAALIVEKILCVHGGLSPDLENLDQIRNLSRPTDIPDHGLLCDLLWSDPAKDVRGWGMNDRGVSYTFGPDKVSEFLERHDLDLVCRGHQVVEDGYEFFAEGQLVTIFSVPIYGGEFVNFGAIMSIDDALMCSFEILKPAEKKSKK